MLDALSLVVDVALFLITVLYVGKKPTAGKVAGMIALIAAIDYGFVAIVALQDGMNPIEWYQGMLDQTLSSYGLGGQVQDSSEGFATSVTAGISPAIYVVQATAYVIVALCIRWIADNVRDKSEWSAFSRVDLSIWWLIPLLLGLVCFIVSLFLPQQAAFATWLVALNVFVVAAIPLFVQGAAVGKAMLNRMGMRFSMQVILGVLGLLSGVLFVVLPVLGLIDFWANFRKLLRESDRTQRSNAE